MTAFKLDKFGGQLPGWDPHILPEGQCADCTNAYLFSGGLTGWREPKRLRTNTYPWATMAYRIPARNDGVAHAYLVFVANPIEGDTVKIGEVRYGFSTDITPGANYIKLGGTAAESAANLFYAATIGLDEAADALRVGANYGIGTEANPAVYPPLCVATPVDTLGYADLYFSAPDVGAAYNTTAVDVGDPTRVQWLYDLADISRTTTTFRGGANATSYNGIGSTAAWLEFTDPDTNVLKSPVVGDRFDRFYIASPSTPPQYTTYDRIMNGDPALLLGLPPPGCPPGVSVTGGGDTNQIGFLNGADVATFDAPGSNMLFLIPITPTAAMSLDSVTATPSDTSTTAQFAAVLYDDNAGAPGKLLNAGAPVIGCTSGTEMSSAFVNPTALAANTRYWIGLFGDTLINFIVSNNVSNGGTSVGVAGNIGVIGAATFSSGPPAIAPAMTTGRPSWLMRGDMTTGAVLEARSYVYTWVTAYGEESPPSPPTIVTGWSNGVWNIGMFQPPPDDMSPPYGTGLYRNITKKRFYRTISAVGGQTDYFMLTRPLTTVGDLPVDLASGIDIVDDLAISLNTILPSATWFPPPEGLQGIVSMPNGYFAGFKGNEVWFSEPYRPHAWPPGYVMTTEFPIVGLGVTGNCLVACTSGTPYAFTGINPASMTSTKILLPEPCNSRGSIVSTLNGVYYTSPNGLILVTGFGIGSNITEAWITREKWAAMTPPYGIRAISLASCYFAWGSVVNGDTTYAYTGFTLPLADDSASFTIWPQPGKHRLGFNRMFPPGGGPVYNVQTDPWTGTGLLIQDAGINYFDFADPVPGIMPYKWKSKIYQQTSKKNFEAMKIFFDIPPNSPTLNATRNTAPTNDSSWLTLPPDRYGIVRVYADGNLITARELRTSGELLRIVSGFKCEMWQWEIEGRVLISNMQAATSVKELGGV